MYISCSTYATCSCIGLQYVTCSSTEVIIPNPIIDCYNADNSCQSHIFPNEGYDIICHDSFSCSDSIVWWCENVHCNADSACVNMIYEGDINVSSTITCQTTNACIDSTVQLNPEKLMKTKVIQTFQWDLSKS